MKGKGKGKVQVSDAKDCPLQFPDFTPVDHDRHCPRYTNLLQKSEDEGVGLEDLDTLQLELETLLVSATKRQDLLEQEMQILINWSDKKEKKPLGKVQPESTGKRSRPPAPEGKNSKKFKEANAKTQTPSTSGRAKSKNVQAKLQEYEFTDSPVVEAPKVQKNDTPNRFWAYVDTYCADITTDDVKVLEDLAKSHDDDAEYYKVPALGKHYSLKWAQEDMIEEQKEGAKTNEKRKGLSNNMSMNSGESERLLKKADKNCESDDLSPFGALTQRLVSCLIEENLMSSLDDSIADSILKDNNEENSSPTTAKGFMKSLNITNAAQLERRIRRELEEQGILDADELNNSTPDDEILSELKKCQAELKVLSAHNMSQIKKLLHLAKEEMAKQELQKKLQIVDAEIAEAYRKILAAKQKKRSPTKREKEQAWKALRERENIIKQINSHE